MNHTDIRSMMAEIAPVIREYTEAMLAPVVARIDGLERRFSDLPTPASPDETEVVDRVRESIKTDLGALRDAVAAIPEAPQLPDLSAMVAEAVEAAEQERAVQLQEWMDEVDEKLVHARADAEIVKRVQGSVPDLVREAVGAAMAAIPMPQDGRSVTLDDVRPLVEDEVRKAVSAIPAPSDGCGVKDVLIDRDGALVFTMDDGRIKNLGPVVGRDGADADMVAIERSIAEKVASLPKPKDGKDGLGFDQQSVEFDGERTVTLVFERDGVRKEFPVVFPVMIYRGGWSKRPYQKGDAVTWAGSQWVATEDTEASPDEARDGKPWRMVVRRGRDAASQARLRD